MRCVPELHPDLLLCRGRVTDALCIMNNKPRKNTLKDVGMRIDKKITIVYNMNIMKKTIPLGQTNG